MLQGLEVQVEARVEVGAGCFRLQYFREREFSQEVQRELDAVSTTHLTPTTINIGAGAQAGILSLR